MSKEQKRKKKLRLDLKRSSIMVAALASVAVGGVAHAAEEVDASTQPSTTTSATESKPNKEVAPEKPSSKVDTSVKPTEKTEKSEPKESTVSETVKPKEVPSTGLLSESSTKPSKLEEAQPSTGAVSTNNPTTETVTRTVQPVKPVSNTENKPAENNSVETPAAEGIVDKPKESGSDKLNENGSENTVSEKKNQEKPEVDSTTTPDSSSEKQKEDQPITESESTKPKNDQSVEGSSVNLPEKSKEEGVAVSSDSNEGSSEKPKEGTSAEGDATNNVSTSGSDNQKEDKPLESASTTTPTEGVPTKPSEESSDIASFEKPNGDKLVEDTSNTSDSEKPKEDGVEGTSKPEENLDSHKEGTSAGGDISTETSTEGDSNKPKEDGSSKGKPTEVVSEKPLGEKPSEGSSTDGEVEKPKEDSKPETPKKEGEETKPEEDGSNTGGSTNENTEKPKETGISDKPSENGSLEKPTEDSKPETPTIEEGVKPVEDNSNTGNSASDEVEKPKEDVSKENPKEGGKSENPTTEGEKEKPTEDGSSEKPKEELPSTPTKPEEEVPTATDGNPALDFTSAETEGIVKKTGTTYTLNTSSRQPILVKVPEGVSPKSVKIYQNLANGSVREINGTRGELYPVSSTITVTYTDEKGEEVTKEVGKIVDTATNAVVAKGSDRKLSLAITPAVTGDSLPNTLTLTTEDGKHTLTGVLKDGSYSFDSSELPEGEYDFKIAEGETTAYGRKFMSEVYHMKGKEVVKPIEPQPEPLPEPVPTPVPEVPSVPETPSVTPEPATPSVPSVDVPVAPSVEVKPLTPSVPAENPSAEKPKEESEKPSVEKPKSDTIVKPADKPSVESPKGEVDVPRVVSPTVIPTVSDHSVSSVTPTPSPVPSFVEQPSSVKPQGAPSTDVSNVNATIITPTKPVETNNTNGNTNTNSSNINIGGVSNQANYTENPNRLTVDVNSGSVREVKATVSSQEGTTELQGRVVNGSFVADKLPEKDGVYTVKVQVTDDKGQVSEKTITYAVNKNGSTYDWLSKGVNGSYYQRLTEDLKLSEHSTTQLDTSKTKFTFTLDGKVITVDASQVKVNEKKEDDGSYTYTYTFNKGAFAENGVWSISVATVDVDGHASSSNASVQFQFVLDNVVPELKIEGIANNNQYNSAKHQFRVLVKDNIGLAKVLVKINGKVYEFTKDELLKGEKVLDLVHSSKPYTIEVEVTDLAGNTTNQTVEGITVSATDIQALLESDNVKIALAIFGTVAFGGLLTWWALAVRSRKRKEEELERYRVGAHIVTEAEGLASSNGSGSVEHTEVKEDVQNPVEAGFVAAEVLESVKDTGSLEVPVSNSASESEPTATLPLDAEGETGSMTEVLDSDEADEVTTVLTELDDDVAEKTTILDLEEDSTEVPNSEEHTTVLDEESTEISDSEGQTAVLEDKEVESTEIFEESERTTVLDEEDQEAESTEVLDSEVESTEVLDSEEHTTVLDEESTEALGSEEKTTILDIEDEELAEKTTILDEVDEDTEVLD